MFESADTGILLELENSNLISETIMASHGTGMAELDFYESIKDIKILMELIIKGYCLFKNLLFF